MYECFLFHVLLTGKVILGAYSVHIPFALCEGNTLSIEPVGADLLLFVLSLSSRLLFSDLSTVRTLVQTHVVQHDLTRNPGSREPLNHYAVYGVRRVLRVFRVYVEWPSPPLSTNLARDRPETIEFFLSVNATVEKKKKKTLSTLRPLLLHQSYGVSFKQIVANLPTIWPGLYYARSIKRCRMRSRASDGHD